MILAPCTRSGSPQPRANGIPAFPVSSHFCYDFPFIFVNLLVVLWHRFFLSACVRNKVKSCHRILHLYFEPRALEGAAPGLCRPNTAGVQRVCRAARAT